MNKLKLQKTLNVLLKHKKALSTITMLSISGLTMLFFMSSEPSDPQDSSQLSQIGIPENMKSLLMGSDESSLGENSLVETKVLGSCASANMIIGKNGIAKCDI